MVNYGLETNPNSLDIRKNWNHLWWWLMRVCYSLFVCFYKTCFYHRRFLHRVTVYQDNCSWNDQSFGECDYMCPFFGHAEWPMFFFIRFFVIFPSDDFHPTFRATEMTSWHHLVCCWVCVDPSEPLLAVWAGIFPAYMWIQESAGWLDGCHTASPPQLLYLCQLPWWASGTLS